MSSTLARTVTIAAPASRVWALVSDLPAMGAYSPENTGGRWLDGATGPAVGAGFRGANQRGRHRWSTRVTVVACVPGEAFAFDVTSAGRPVARWSYALTATEQGCTVTETWLDQRGRVLAAIGRRVTGERDRASFTAASIEQTLAALKAHAEAG